MKTGVTGNEPRALQSTDAGSTAPQKPTGPLAANMREVRQGEGQFTATGMSTAPAGGAPDEISTEDLIARFDKLRAGSSDPAETASEQVVSGMTRNKIAQSKEPEAVDVPGQLKKLEDLQDIADILSDGLGRLDPLGQDDDVAGLRDDLLPNSARTASGGPSDDPTPGPDANAGGTSAPVATPPAGSAGAVAPSCASTFKEGALKKLFAHGEPGHADQLAKIFSSSPTPHAQNRVQIFADQLEAFTLKVEADATLSTEAKAKALQDVRGTATKYVKLLLKEGLGHESPFGGAYYAGKGNAYKTVAHLNATLLSQIGANEKDGGKALFDALCVGFVQPYILNRFNTEWAGEIQLTAKEFLDAMLDQSAQTLVNAVLEKLEACSKTGEKSFLAIGIMLDLALELEKLLRDSVKKAAADPADPADPANSSKSPKATEASVPPGITYNFNGSGPVHIGDNINVHDNFNSELNNGVVQGIGVRAEEDIKDIKVEDVEGEDVVDGRFEVDDDAASETSEAETDLDFVYSDGEDEGDIVQNGGEGEELPGFDRSKLNVSKPEAGGFGAKPSIELVTINREPIEAEAAPVQALAIEPEPVDTRTNVQRWVARLNAAHGQDPAPSSMLPKMGRYATGSYLGNFDPVELSWNRKDRKQMTGKSQPQLLDLPALSADFENSKNPEAG